MTARLAVIALATIFAFGGIGAAAAELFDDDNQAAALDTIELRKDDAGGDTLVDDDDPQPDPGDGDATRGDDGTGGGNNTGDGDRTRGDDGTSGGNNTGDGDRTRGNDGTGGGNNTYVGDRDATWGDDGTGGGDNSYVAPAAGGGSYSGGGDT